MGLKEFFKPNLWKIILFTMIIIFAIIKSVLTACPCVWASIDYDTGKMILSDYAKDTIRTQWFIFPTLLLDLIGVFVPSFVTIIINLIYWYILSCLIIWIIFKFKK